MIKINKIAVIIFLSGIMAVACKKEGPGGKSSVSGAVKHHTELIPNAIVYIKYDAKEFPGANVSIYDASSPADANAHYEFKELQKGDYYLYAVGYDSTEQVQVTGGIGVKLKRNEAKATDVPVTE